MKEQALAKTLITAWHAGSLSSEGSAAEPPQTVCEVDKTMLGGWSGL
jgi:hypothetical protein